MEILKADGSSWCSLPDLPDERYHHTQSGMVVCGGWDTKTSCLSFISGTWRLSHTLLHERTDHSAWVSPSGIILIGGSRSAMTTEMLTEDGKSVEAFSLKYET